MSHIPSSAMPRARAKDGQEKEGGSIKKRAGKIADKARDNPKTAIAAGAVLAGAVAAAAALPLVRRAKNKPGADDSSGGAKTKKS